MFFSLYVDPETRTVSTVKNEQYFIEVLPKKSTGEDGRWMWGQQKVQNNLNQLEARLILARNEWDVFARDYLANGEGEKRTRKFKTLWNEKALNYQNGTKTLKKLFETNQSFIEYPKPVHLLKQIITMSGGNTEDIFLDFFAGSATTAHAVLDLNQEDGGNRKFLCIQYPEKTPENSSTRKAGYNTIADIGRARIRKVIEQMNAERAAQLPLGERSTPGFRAFKLAPSNFKIWRSDLKTGAEIMAQLEFHVDPTLNGNEEHKLWELLLKAGYPLSAKVETRQIEGVTVYDVEDGQMMIALQALNPAVIKAVRQSKAQTFICLDKLFNEDNQLKTNTDLQMKEEGIIFQTI